MDPNDAKSPYLFRLPICRVLALPSSIATFLPEQNALISNNSFAIFLFRVTPSGRSAEMPTLFDLNEAQLRASY